MAKLLVLNRIRGFSHWGLLAMGLAAAVAAACASSGKSGGGETGSSAAEAVAAAAVASSSAAAGVAAAAAVRIIGPSTCSPSAQCTDFANVSGVSCSNGDCVAVDTSGPTAIPSNPGSLFSSPSTSGGPCLVEPQDGTMFPNGWTRARISWAPVSNGQNLFQVRLHSDSENNDLVVYTSNTNITLPKALWTALSTNLVGPSIAVTVTATSANGGSAASSETANFTIAGVPALGALIYWTSSSFDTTGANAATTTELKGFHVGDEGTTVALTVHPGRAAGRAPDRSTAATSPAARSASSASGAIPPLPTATTSPSPRSGRGPTRWPPSTSGDSGVAVGQPPPWLTGGAAANLSPLIGPASANGVAFYAPPVVNQVMLGVQTFSPAHYTTGDRKVVSSLGASQNSTSNTAPNTFTGVISQLAWFDLEWTGTPGTTGFATAPCGNNPSPPATCFPVSTSNGGWGIIARNGDTQSAGAPSWSHNVSPSNLDLIAYTSSDNGTKDGRLDNPGTGGADIYTVPFNNGAGGNATKVAGASDPNFNEYYPSWSPDDSLIAFNRVGAGNSMYDQPLAEVYVVESGPASCDGQSGAAQCRLKANDPVACTNSKSPGVQNTWPKWAPLPNLASNGTATNKGSDGKLYYYMTFSSTRATACTLTAGSGALNTLCTASQSQAASGFAQLYVTPIVVDPNNGNAITTYPAIYMWNQDAALNNLIPSWDYFPIASGTQAPLQ